MREELAIKNLKELKEILDRFEVRYWLDYGTLLGAIRNGKFIEWDEDVDLGAMDESWDRIASALPKLKEKGFRVRLSDNVLGKWISLCRFGHPISICLYQVKDENAWRTHESHTLISKSLKVLYSLLLRQKTEVSRPKFVIKALKSCISLLPPKLKKPLSDVVWFVLRRSYRRLFQIVIPKHYFEQLDTIEFYGMKFNIPSNIEDYLKYHYGEDWKTPKREWDWLRDDGAVRVLKA